MNDAMHLALLAPISEAHPSGENLSYSRLFDEIREARRADDPLLNQGDWETSIKQADWSRVRQLCEHALQNETKDLQLAAWYIEALTHLNYFSGLTFGFKVLQSVLEQFWESLHPALDLDDLDERISRFEWLNKQLPGVIREIPLVHPQQGGYSWYAWNESRDVKNLGLKDPLLRDTAITSGKLSDERFDKAARESGKSYYEELASDVVAARTELNQLETVLESLMGSHTPNMGDLRRALLECNEVIELIQGQWEVRGGAELNMKTVQINTTENAATASASAPSGVAVCMGTITTRSDALHALRQVAQYFRTNEPHSPVALLAERAARWGEMPLEAWLASVIKDDTTLHQLNDLLDVRYSPSGTALT